MTNSGLTVPVLQAGDRHFLWVAWLFFLPTLASGQLETQFYHTESFGIEDGLNQEVINHFQIDKHGMVWIYTVGSLQLFDGEQFIDMNYLFEEEPLYASFNGSNYGEIYFISRNILIHINPDDYTSKPLHSLKLPDSYYEEEHNYVIHESKEHLFVVNSNDSVYQIRKPILVIEDAFALPEKPNKSLSPGLRSKADHVLEYVSENYRLFSIDLKTKKIISVLDLNLVDRIIRISPDTFVTIDPNFLSLYIDQEIIKIPFPDETQKFIASDYLLYSQDKLWIALKNNMYEFDLRMMKWKTIHQKIGGAPLTELGLRKCEMDKYGNIYFSTFNNGLVKVYPRNKGFDYIAPRDLKNKFIKCLSLSETNNLILAGTVNGLWIFDTTGSLVTNFMNLPDGNQLKGINNIVKISDSRFVVITNGAFELSIEKEEIEISKIEGLHPDWPSSYSVNVELPGLNKYYTSYWDGLLEYKIGNDIQFKYTESHPLDGSFAIARYNDGFISSKGNKLKLLDLNLQNVIRQLTIPGYGYSRCIIQYSKNSVLLGTDVGLYHIQIDNEANVMRQIYDKMVYAILPGDNPREFWFSTDFGLFRLTSDFQLINYSKEEGLQDNEFNTNACYKSATGKLYFGGVNGINSFYPSEVSESSDNIQQYVSSLSVNNKVLARYIPSANNRSFDFSYKENNIGIELLGKGDKSPGNYNYQYFMKGLNEEWVDMGRDNSINFHLAPGNYTFYYHIGDNFNPNAPKTHFFKLFIQPPVYKRWWFITGIMVMLLSLGLYVLYVNKKRHLLKLSYENKLSQKIYRERMRISRELHDNIGAQMATVKRNISFITSQRENLSQKQIMKKMEDLESISTQINQELRDTIWVTQHEFISLTDFITRLKNYVFQTLGPESDCRVHYIEQFESNLLLGPFLALNLHRICQETINNAIKHSRCSEIRIVFEGNANSLKITLTDNGTGYETDTIHAGYGLQNIRHRASLIGAELQFNRLNTSGASLEILIDKIELSNKSFDGWRE